MKMRRPRCGLSSITRLGIVVWALAGSARADQEASNVAHVVTGAFGRCFAHAVPDAPYGDSGVTRLYAVGESLVEMNAYPWFAQSLYIACNIADGKGTMAPAVVALGPWPRGHAPDDKTLAIAFHYDGDRVAQYSTLDIAAGDPKNASCSVSHYTVIREVEGFAPWLGSGPLHFSVLTVDGRRLVFDAVSGALVEWSVTAPDEPRGACFDAVQ